MTGDPLVSIVVLTRNRAEELASTLGSLGEVSYRRAEIIVVDNGSDNGVSAEVRRISPSARFVELEENTGVAGWNRGFAVARGEYVLVMDDDAFPLPESVDRAVRYLRDHPEAGVLAFNVVNARTLKTDTWWPRRTPHSGIERVASFVGAAAMIRKSVLDAVGGFSEEFFLYVHEEEFSARVLRAGHEIHLVESILALHHAAESQRSAGRRIVFHETNTVFYFLIYFPFSTVQWKMAGSFLRVIRESVVSVRPGLFSRYVWRLVGGIPRVLKKREVLDKPVRDFIRTHWPMPGTHVRRSYSLNRLKKLDLDGKEESRGGK